MGQTLLADHPTITDGDGIPGDVAYTYQWMRVDEGADADISGATAAACTLTTEDVGKQIKVEVSFTDSGGNDESATSAATQIVGLPGISSVELTSDPGDDRTCAIGETVTATVTFDQEVAVTGSPQLTRRIGGGRPEEQKQAEYTCGTGARALRFQYAVEGNDRDDDGIFLERNELTLNGGTIKDATGTVDASLDYERQGTQEGHNVDGVRPEPTQYQQVYAPGGSEDGRPVALTFNEPLPTMTSRPGAFRVTVDSSSRRVAPVSVDQDENTLTLNLYKRDRQRAECEDVLHRRHERRLLLRRPGPGGQRCPFLRRGSGEPEAGVRPAGRGRTSGEPGGLGEP